MGTLIGRLLSRSQPQQLEERYSLEQYIADVQAFYYSGHAYSAGANLQQTYEQRPTESIEVDFVSMVRGAYKRNGIVFACQVSRLSVFSQASFAWQQMRPSGPAELFFSRGLEPLKRPWVNGSEGELLARMIQDVDNAGNAYVRRRPPASRSETELERLRPDWVDIVLDGDPGMVTPTVVGYVYYPGGRNSGQRPVPLAVDEVAHWSPYPDPEASFRGMAPLTPILREVRADSAATDHKGQFFDHAATPNLAVKFDPSISVDKFKRFKELMEADHSGTSNAWKTLYLGGGADVTQLGMSFQQMDYKAVQALGETRIAAAYGVPAVIAQISEGLQGSSLNQGNFAAGRRLFADKTIRWLWKDCCAALERILVVPERARLWTDDRQVSFLREDQKDAAEIQAVKASTIASLVREGFTPESVINAVNNEDFGLLEHTGALSVQLIDPNSPPPANESSEPPPDEGENDDEDEGSADE